LYIVLNDFELLKIENWLVYPLSGCVCVLIYVCDNRVSTREQMVLHQMNSWKIT